MGALESSVRYDSAVETGIQAYNEGMQHIVNRIAGTMFISASIAPLFPYKYAHARRVSCDTRGAAVGKILSSEYEVNSAAYGWWESGSLYALNDPDAMLFDGFPASDNMTRLLSAVVSGTVFLNGDDLSGATGQGLARTYLTNPAIDAVARLGQAFRPVEGNTGSSAPDLFVLENQGTAYLAVFNFTTASANRTIDLARVGLDGTKTYSVTDLWTGSTSTAKGTATLQVDTHFAKLLAFE
jgi:alpha-galactosidase